MKKKILSIALAVCLILSLTTAFTPVFASAGVGDSVAWDIEWLGGNNMYLSWSAVAGATSYKVEHAGSRLADTWTVVEDAIATAEITCGVPNSNKYENYFRITPDNGADPILISLEGKIFGENCYFYSEDDNRAAVIDEISSVGAEMGLKASEFSEERYAFFFKPGDYAYNDRILVGFYTSVYGLGKLPTDVALYGVRCESPLFGNNTQTFWRSIENVQVNYSLEHGTDIYYGFNWCVAQAAPARRIDSVAECHFEYGGPPNNWSSPGFFADCVFHNSFTFYSQQNYTRNSDLAGGTYAKQNWQTFLQGCTASGPNDLPPHSSDFTKSNVTNLEMDRIREKPFIYLDGDTYKVFVPGWRDGADAQGVTWGEGKENDGMGIGTSKDLLSSFYIAYPGVDTADSINAALDAGKHLLLTPGIYQVEEPIHVTKPNTIVLGLGYATLVPDENNEYGAMLVEDVDGCIISGIMFDAWYSSIYLLRVGETGEPRLDHQANPVMLSDLFFRVGGFTVDICQVDVALSINSNDVVTDHFWIWRADHTDNTGLHNGSVGWEKGMGDYGLWISGDRVRVHALFNEHFQKYTTYWEGEDGILYFLQNETPYDPLSQDVWMSHQGTVNGYAQLKVANSVEHFAGYGLGSYPCLINVPTDAPTTVYATNGFEVPITPGVTLTNVFLYNLSSGKGGATEFIVNNAFPYAKTTSVSQYPPASGDPGTQPLDDPDDPDLKQPDYASRGLSRPFPIIEEKDLLFHSVIFDITKLISSRDTFVWDGDDLSAMFKAPSLGWLVPDDITVTMGGAPFTEFTYTPNGDRTYAAIAIEAITGDVVITADGDWQGAYVTCNLTALTSDAPQVVMLGDPLVVTLTADKGYMMPESVTVTMGGDETDFDYSVAIDKKSATITIDEVTADVVITADAEFFASRVTYDLTGISNLNAPAVASYDEPFGVKLLAANGYWVMPDDVEVIMGGVTLIEGVGYTYDRIDDLSAMLTILDVTGDLEIHAAAYNTADNDVPPDGADIYLLSFINGKIVLSSEDWDRMVAEADELTDENTEYAQLTAYLAGGRVYLVGANDKAIIVGCDWWPPNLVVYTNKDIDRDQDINDQVDPDGDWESLNFEVQPDGTVKIYRLADEPQPVGGIDYTEIYVDVTDDGLLRSIGGGVGDSGKFMWYFIDQIVTIPVDKAALLGALNRFNSLEETLYTEVTWAFAAEVAAEAQTVFDNADATQEEADAAAAALKEALDALELITDRFANPKEGATIYLVSKRTGMFVGAVERDEEEDDGAKHWTAPTNAQTTLQAIFDSVVGIEEYTAYEVYHANDRIYLKAGNDKFFTIEGNGYGDGKVRPRSGAIDGSDTGWASLIFIPQTDGTCKIQTIGNEGGSLVPRWVDVRENGELFVTWTEPGESGKFRLVEMPNEGDVMALISQKTGKIVGAEDRDDVWTETPNSMATLKAIFDSNFTIQQYTDYKVEWQNDRIYLKAGNDKYFTVEGNGYGDGKVRPRSGEKDASPTGWASLIFVPQTDGTFKIQTIGSEGGVLVPRWVDVNEDGELFVTWTEPGDSAKFKLSKYPNEGDIITLTSKLTGQLVGVNDPNDNWLTDSGILPSMSADFDSIDVYTTYVVYYREGTAYLLAGNGMCVTIENSAAQGVRPRTTPFELSPTGWSRLYIVLNADGSLMFHAEPENYRFMVVDADDSRLIPYGYGNNDNTLPGDAGKFNYTVVGVAVAPADKEALLAAIEAFEALNESDWPADSWALADAAYQIALGLYDDGTLTALDQDDIDAATLALLDAIEGLVAAGGDIWAVSLDPTEYDFGSVPFDYDEQTPLEVTVTNAGNIPTGDMVAVWYLSPGFGWFDFGWVLPEDWTPVGVLVGDSISFIVTPLTGLPAGTYTAGIGVYKETDEFYDDIWPDLTFDDMTLFITFTVGEPPYPATIVSDPEPPPAGKVGQAYNATFSLQWPQYSMFSELQWLIGVCQYAYEAGNDDDGFDADLWEAFVNAYDAACAITADDDEADIVAAYNELWNAADALSLLDDLKWSWFDDLQWLIDICRDTYETGNDDEAFDADLWDAFVGAYDAALLIVEEDEETDIIAADNDLWNAANALGLFVYGALKFTVTGGALPDGLTLTTAEDETAVLSGTPTKAGTYTFTITAAWVSDDAESYTYAVRSFTIVIDEAGGFGPGFSGGGTTIVDPETPPPLANPFPFTDVSESDWFYDDVYYAWENELVNGTSATLFSPYVPITRGMVVTILYRAEGEPDVSGLDNPFPDVADGQYYTDAVLWAADNGIVLGYKDGTYQPDKIISRQELAAILFRYASCAEIELPELRDYEGFADDADIAEYAQEAVEALYMAGVINGKPNNLFDPLGSATRAEFAAMLRRLLEI